MKKLKKIWNGWSTTIKVTVVAVVLTIVVGIIL